MSENARFKELVAQHAELSRNLHAIPTRAQTSVKLTQQTQLQSTVERSILFNALEQKLDARFPSVDEIVKRAAAPVMTQMIVSGGDTSNPVVGTIQRSKKLPFQRDAVHDVLWRWAERDYHALASTLSPVSLM